MRTNFEHWLRQNFNFSEKSCENAQISENIYTLLKNKFISIEEIPVFLFDKYYKQKLHMKQIDENFYRGSQVNVSDIKNVAEKGIKTIINLKVECQSNLKILINESEKYGINYINLPINPCKPTLLEIEELKEIYAQIENYPIIVHCSRGIDRTGFATAIYRICKYNWSPKKAFEIEMKKYGFKELYFPSLKKVLYNVEIPASA